MSHDLLPRSRAIWVFVAMASAYFLSTMLRAVTATLSPTLSQEFALQAKDLGLLAGGYFLGFSLTQLPMGRWLDQYGPKKVVLSFLCLAVVGCLAFAMAPGFAGLLLARVLIGVGVSACLMAPLTGYRRWFALEHQQRANAWMLMTGAFGMLASTLPVQWLLPLVGWRWIFAGVAALIVMSMALMAWQVPVWQQHTAQTQGPREGLLDSYAQVWAHPYFRAHIPMGFFNYGGLIAMQTLWAGPWMIKVAGYTPLEAATGLFGINVCMLITYWAWGMITPTLTAKGWHANRLMMWGLPLSLLTLTYIIASGAEVGAVAWAVYCVTSTFVALAQPAVGMAFPAVLAGRALSAYNLVLFLGIFVVQWGFGLLVDAFKGQGLPEAHAYQSALSVFGVCCVAAYVRFLKRQSDG